MTWIDHVVRHEEAIPMLDAVFYDGDHDADERRGWRVKSRSETPGRELPFEYVLQLRDPR